MLAAAVRRTAAIKSVTEYATKRTTYLIPNAWPVRMVNHVTMFDSQKD